jgi:isoleucyl-tRNA synthetase
MMKGEIMVPAFGFQTSFYPSSFYPVDAGEPAHAAIQQAIEKARQEKKIGSNLEATVALTLPDEGFTHAVVTESSHHKGARCWKHLPDVVTHDTHPTLCGRCVEAVG